MELTCYSYNPIPGLGPTTLAFYLCFSVGQHSPTKKDIVSFRELDSTIVDRFFAADYDTVLEFFPARQDFEIIGHLTVKNGLYCSI
jgi:hypothetical protein